MTYITPSKLINMLDDVKSAFALRQDILETVWIMAVYLNAYLSKYLPVGP